MNTRQSNIFTTIIKEYIKTASPISSQQVLDVAELDVSSATVRNDMAALEKEGLIIQPHTSAGRIPTEHGYQLYVDNYMGKKKLERKYVTAVQEFLEQTHGEYQLKFLAKVLAQISGVLVFVAFDTYDIYYTGLSQLLGQPEFINYDRMYDISKVVDHMDEVIHTIYKNVTKDVQILIGRQSPFSGEISTLLAAYPYKDASCVLGLIGPMRMDYEMNLALMKYVGEVIGD